MINRQLHLGALALFVLLAACQDRAPIAPAMPTVVAPAPATPRADTAAPTGVALAQAWAGHWTGPEGTALDLAEVGQKVSIRIQSLDGPASYEGSIVGDHIEFIRDGKVESLRATDGVGTGMKWLADKKDCLVIQASEGFCRD